MYGRNWNAPRKKTGPTDAVSGVNQICSRQVTIWEGGMYRHSLRRLFIPLRYQIDFVALWNRSFLALKWHFVMASPERVQLAIPNAK